MSYSKSATYNFSIVKYNFKRITIVCVNSVINFNSNTISRKFIKDDV